jgi:hypothetical protein
MCNQQETQHKLTSGMFFLEYRYNMFLRPAEGFACIKHHGKETNCTMDITMSTWLLSSSFSETPCKHQVAISIDMEF